MIKQLPVESVIDDPRPLTARRKLLGYVFYLIFFLVFCLSGILSMLSLITGKFPYRMGLVSALVVPFLLVFRIKINRILIAYAALAGIVLLSGIVNHSSLSQIILFYRTLGFSFLIYFLVDTYINPDNLPKVLKLCIWIACFQLPIVILQKLTYDYLPATIRASLIRIDFDFGSFNYKGDPALAIFLTFIVIFLLFDRNSSRIVKYRWPVIVWLTLTVLLLRSDITRLAMMLIWGIYALIHIKRKWIFFLSAFLVVAAIMVIASGVLNPMIENALYQFSRLTSTSTTNLQYFLAGAYSRGAAIKYYISRGILWLGDGPSRYYEPIYRIRILGNYGHIFTFYSEIGIFGWLLSVLIFLFIAFPGRIWNYRVTLVGLLAFLSIQALSFTTEIMNDVSIVMIFCIISKVCLLDSPKPPDPVLGESSQTMATQ